MDARTYQNRESYADRYVREQERAERLKEHHSERADMAERVATIFKGKTKQCLRRRNPMPGDHEVDVLLSKEIEAAAKRQGIMLPKGLGV